MGKQTEPTMKTFNKGDEVFSREALITLFLKIDWEDGNHAAFDSTVHFSNGYDFFGLEHMAETLTLEGRQFMIWPNGVSHGKWSLYDTIDGGMWFEKFNTKAAAKRQAMEVLLSEIESATVSGIDEEPTAETAFNAEVSRDILGLPPGGTELCKLPFSGQGAYWFKGRVYPQFVDVKHEEWTEWRKVNLRAAGGGPSVVDGHWSVSQDCTQAVFCGQWAKPIDL